MARPVRRRLALAVALAAVLAGGTAVALGATGASHPHRPHAHGARTRPHLHQRPRPGGLLAASSSYLGLPPAQLRNELAAGETLGQIAKATPGRSEAGLVAALVASVKQRRHAAGAGLPERVERLVHGRRAHDRAARVRRPGLMALARSYLGAKRSALLKQLRTGMTLSQVADATPGKSAAGLREAIILAVSERVDARVSADALTAGAAKHRLSHIETKIDTLLNRPHVRRGTGAHTPPGA